MTTTTETEYVNASEAARILGVSRQRVAKMVMNDEIEFVRPWPRQVLIPRIALAGWMRGDRPTPIHKTACRRWILDRENVDNLDALELDYLTELVAVFIAERRPEWDTESKANWCVGMIRLLGGRA
jgi:excisionase family DNA binding protein